MFPWKICPWEHFFYNISLMSSAYRNVNINAGFIPIRLAFSMLEQYIPDYLNAAGNVLSDGQFSAPHQIFRLMLRAYP